MNSTTSRTETMDRRFYEPTLLYGYVATWLWEQHGKVEHKETTRQRRKTFKPSIIIFRKSDGGRYVITSPRSPFRGQLVRRTEEDGTTDVEPEVLWEDREDLGEVQIIDIFPTPLMWKNFEELMAEVMSNANGSAETVLQVSANAGAA